VEHPTKETTVVVPSETILVVLGVTGFGHCRACAKTPVAKAVLTDVVEAVEVEVVVRGVGAMDVVTGA